jgi:hypothetical protein
MIRDAKASDVPAIIAFLQERYRSTHYAKSGLAQIDVVFTKKLLLMAIHRHGHKTENACWVQVVDRFGRVCGLMLATLARVYVIGNRLMATDVFFVVNDTARATDAGELLQGMFEWAKRSPACVEIRCGATAVIGDPARTGKMLERFGMEPYGSLHRLEIKRAA